MNGTLRPHRGGMILTFGILGLVCCVIFAILAWVMGSADLNEMAAGSMDPAGEGLTKAGKIMGIIGCALQVLGILVWVLFFGGMMAAGMAHH